MKYYQSNYIGLAVLLLLLLNLKLINSNRVVKIYEIIDELDVPDDKVWFHHPETLKGSPKRYRESLRPQFRESGDFDSSAGQNVSEEADDGNGNMIDGAITALGAGVLLFCCSFPGNRAPELCDQFLDVKMLRAECRDLLSGKSVFQNGLTLEETAHGRGIQDDGEDALTEFTFGRHVHCKCAINETNNAIAHCRMSSKHLTEEEGDIMCRAFLPSEQFGFSVGINEDQDVEEEFSERYRQKSYPRPQGRLPQPQSRLPQPQARLPQPQGRLPRPQGRLPRLPPPPPGLFPSRLPFPPEFDYRNHRRPGRYWGGPPVYPGLGRYQDDEILVIGNKDLKNKDGDKDDKDVKDKDDKSKDDKDKNDKDKDDKSKDDQDNGDVDKDDKDKEENDNDDDKTTTNLDESTTVSPSPK